MTRARTALKHMPWGKRTVKRLAAGEEGSAARDALSGAVATSVLICAQDCDLQVFVRAARTWTEEAQTNQGQGRAGRGMAWVPMRPVQGRRDEQHVRPVDVP